MTSQSPIARGAVHDLQLPEWDAEWCVNWMAERHGERVARQALGIALKGRRGRPRKGQHGSYDDLQLRFIYDAKRADYKSRRSFAIFAAEFLGKRAGPGVEPFEQVQ